MKIYRIVLLAVLACMLAYGVFHFYPLHSSRNGDAGNIAAAGVDSLERALRNGRGGAGYRIEPAAESLQRGEVDEKAIAESLFASDPRLVALSEEEAEWMKRHYYPTPEDLANLSSIDTEALAGTKDPRLATLQGLALLEKGETMGGISVLNKAAALGSIYAYQEAALAEYELFLERHGNDPVGDMRNLLMARLEVASVLGDHTTRYLVDQHLGSHDRRRHAYAIQLQVNEYLRQMGSEAQLLGVTPPGPDPRPNSGLWNDLYELHRLSQTGTGAPGP